MFPLKITFRDIPPSEALETYIRARAAKLEQFHQRITSCQVTLEMAHQRSGHPFHIGIDLVLPGGEVVAGHARDADPELRDAHAAIDHAFDQAGRRLQDQLRRQRGDVKPHEDAYQDAQVSKLWGYEGYGFLTTAEGDEVYFHKNSVLHHAFGKMKIGSHVRFVEEMGDKGPQASTVVLVG